MANGKHAWTFFRAGGVDQVALKTGDDVARLADLDQKLWVALATPTKGTELDERTMQFVDSDKDGRVRPPEVLEAIAWARKVFTTLDTLFDKGSKVALSAFAKTDEGKEVLTSAKRILREVGKKDEKEIALEDVEAMEKALVSTRFNGDGVVPADSADDETVKKVIEEILGAVGSVADRSGKPGVDQKLVAQFFEEADAAIAWEAAAKEEALNPLGDGTAKAASAIAAVEAKVDDWFARARLAAFDARGAAALSAPEAELVALGQKTLAAGHEDIKRLALSAIKAEARLPLDAGLNPAWVDAIAALKADAIVPALGDKAELVEAEWMALKAKLQGHRDHASKKPATKTAELGGARLAEIVASGARAKIEALIAEDAALEAEFTKIADVEKAIRLKRDLATLLRNFVNFSDFYAGKGATFQAGKLFLDARSCDLVIYVNDAGKHAALAGLSSSYLVYCDITRPGADKRSIVAAFTNGDTDDLMVGRNGVFYDRAGKDWDATITSIIENPISIRQAFFAPYKRLVRLIEEQVAKRAAEKEKESTGKIDAAATSAANADATPPPPAPGAAPAAAPAPAAPAPTKFDAGTLAAISLVITGITGFLTAALGTFLGLGIWMPFGVLAVLLAISGPSMLIAWLKLRRRSLGPILDANGWAVNTRARINVPFGTSLTHLAKLPEGAARTLDDPFEEKPTPWRRWVLLAIVVVLGGAWLVGKLDSYLPDKYKASTVLHRAPEGAAPAPSSSVVAPPAK